MTLLGNACKTTFLWPQELWFLRPTQRKSHFDFGGFIGLLVNLQIELGTACGKLFRCSTMAILDAGDSDILSDQQA